MSETKLKPCAHCNGEATISTGWKGASKRYFVECFDCAASTDMVETEAEAIAAWNRRYLCPDKHGKPVYAGDEVDLVAGDRFEKCHRGCIVTPLRNPRYGYGLVAKSEDSDFTTHTFYPHEIELVAESEREG